MHDIDKLKDELIIEKVKADYPEGSLDIKTDIKDTTASVTVKLKYGWFVADHQQEQNKMLLRRFKLGDLERVGVVSEEVEGPQVLYLLTKLEEVK